MQKGVFDTRQFTLLRKQKLTFALVTQLIIFVKRTKIVGRRCIV